MPVYAGTGEMMLQWEYVVRDGSVVDGSVSSDSQMGCGDCVSAETWCQGRPEICDNSSWQYVGYVGCDPDCVDQPVPNISNIVI